MIGLAKRFEEIIIQVGDANGIAPNLAKIKKINGFITQSDNFYSVSLPTSSHVVKLLQRVRDESHRFAVSYHSNLKRSRQTKSLLDEVPGVGPITKKKLIRTFGSASAVLDATPHDLQKTLGPKKGDDLAKIFKSIK